MSTISVPTRDKVNPDAQLLFDVLKKRIGKVPNLYAAMGHSAIALKSFTDLEQTLNGSVFSAKEREAVALVVSEVNACAYCLAGHTVLAMNRGFKKEETLAIRRGTVDDARLNAIIQLAKAIAETKGKPEDEYLTSFYNAGFNEGAVMELIALVTLRVFTNYAFAIANVPIDFPLAENL